MGITSYARKTRHSLTLVLVFTQFAAAQSLHVPTPAVPPIESGTERIVTAEIIESRRQQAESAPDLDAATRQQIIDLYQQATDALYRAGESSAKADSLRQQIDGVAARLSQIQQRLDELRATPSAPPDRLGLSELEQELAKMDRSLQESKQAQSRAEGEPSARAARRKEVRNLLFSVPQQLQEIDRQLELPPPRGEPALLSLARRTELLARRMAIEQSIPCLQNELANYDAEDAVDLVRYQRDLSIQEVAVTERRFQWLDGRIKQLRELAARDAVRQAEEEAFGTSERLKELAARNTELAAETQKLTQLAIQAGNQLRMVNTDLETVRRLYGQSKTRVDTVGLTRAVGVQLRKQKASLPNVSHCYATIRSRQRTIEDIQFGLLELDDER
ncbi:MAG: hypothetical protein JJ992_09310, partial [Planctomycetes bacterium]|nr:hypothetical protein [Planctomycetota bacterium]